MKRDRLFGATVRIVLLPEGLRDSRDLLGRQRGRHEPVVVVVQKILPLVWVRLLEEYAYVV